MDPRQTLEKNLPCPERRVADFAVAHYAVRETDVFTVGEELAVRVFGKEVAVKGHFCVVDGVEWRVLPNAESIEHD